MFLEQLLEFEESLAETAPSCNLLMLNNLDLKADLNRFASTSTSHDAIGAGGIAEIIALHDAASDEATTCDCCHAQVFALTASCCKTFVEAHALGFLSSLERDYWTAFLCNPYKTMLALPHYSKLAFLQTGIPFQLRSVVWQKLISVNQKNLSGVPEEASILFANFQHSYNRTISEQINKDLTRTFPSMHFFQRKDTVDSLLTILNVYANYDLDLGYCQGLLFLVGTLYYNLRNSESTFHALCKIMESEPELRAIFVPSTMSVMLEKWHTEFHSVFSAVDPQLCEHLSAFCDTKVFLFQWWLSITLIHAPEFSINNRIVEFCLTEGWKIGIFKISLGLLARNRQILLSFAAGDEEVIYQHLLNESKWGQIVNDVTGFFGDLLLSWNENLFTNMGEAGVPQYIQTTPKRGHKKTNSSVFSVFKNLSIAPRPSVLPTLVANSTASFSSTDTYHQRRLLVSVFSTTRDTESIYSDFTCSTSWEKGSKLSSRKDSFCGPDSALEDLMAENEALRALLRKAHDSLTDEALKKEISCLVADVKG